MCSVNRVHGGSNDDAYGKFGMSSNGGQINCGMVIMKHSTV